MEEINGSAWRVTSRKGCYYYSVEGYNALSTRVGDCIESPEFTLCGKLWQLRIFPGGSLLNHKGYLSFYLASKSDVRIRASYKLTVMSQVSGGDHQTFPSSCIRVFEPRGVQVRAACKVLLLCCIN